MRFRAPAPGLTSGDTQHYEVKPYNYSVGVFYPASSRTTSPTSRSTTRTTTTTVVRGRGWAMTLGGMRATARIEDGISTYEGPSYAAVSSETFQGEFHGALTLRACG